MPDNAAPLSNESTAFRAALDVIRAVEPRVADAIGQEVADQREMLKLMARFFAHVAESPDTRESLRAAPPSGPRASALEYVRVGEGA